MDVELLELTKENYEEEVINSERPWSSILGSPLCPLPVPHAGGGEVGCGIRDKIKFCKVNSAKNQRLCIELKVMALPTFLFYKDGQVVDKLTGMRPPGRT